MKRKTFSFHEKLVLLMVIPLIIFVSCSKTGGVSVPPPNNNPPPPKPAPTLSISAEKSIVEYADSVRINWSASANSESVVVDGVLRTSLSGYFYAKALTAKKTFTGTVTATGFSPVSASTTVDVIPNPVFEKLIGTPWVLTKIETRPEGSSWVVHTINPCWVDDTHGFTIEKRYIWNRITVPCNPGEENFEGNWRLIENNSKIIRGDTLSITVSETTLVLEQRKPDLITGIPTDIRMTYNR